MVTSSKRILSSLILLGYCFFLVWMSTCVFGSETRSHHHHHGPIHHQHNPLVCGWVHSVGDGAIVSFGFGVLFLFLLGRLFIEPKKEFNLVFSSIYSGRAPPLHFL